MGKKAKVGKSRRDQYYFMAKESGYKSRAAFKLIHLNQRFHFLETAKVVIDLCAAPGGWLQVAANTVKGSSLIIGVDLDKIQPIKGVITFQSDITTDKCRELIKSVTKTHKADVVLHDGAPNVGANWNVDESQQIHLCLKAFALATHFLVKGGTFVTKVFRSKDYESLKWVLMQMFQKVDVVKPKSSRLESAEIFLVCQKYKAPNPIDPKFLDPAHVFEELKEEEKEMTFARMMKRKKAVGYEDGDKLYKEINATELIQSDKPMNLLLTANKVIIDDQDLSSHEMTTDVVKQYFSDLKLLGKPELKTLQKWVKHMLIFYKKLHAPPEEETVSKEAITSKTEDELLGEQIEKCETELRKEQRKKLKKQRKEKMKQIRNIQLDMLHPTDRIEMVDDENMFSASKSQDLIEKGIIKIDVDVSDLDRILISERNAKKKALAQKNDGTTKNVKPYEKGEAAQYDTRITGDESANESDVNSDDELFNGNDEKDEFLPLNECEDDDDDIESFDDESDEEEQDDKSDESDVEMDEVIEDEADSEVDVDLDNDTELPEKDEEKTKNRKRKIEITDLDFDPSAPTKADKRSKRGEAWFNSDEFLSLLNDDPDESDDVDTDDEVIEDISDLPMVVPTKSDVQKGNDSLSLTKKEVTNNQKSVKDMMKRLTAGERALLAEMLKSEKSRRDVLDWARNRYQFKEQEDRLPAWFVDSEKKHMRPHNPFVKRSDVAKQKDAASTNINKRTIKKVEQAKARKKYHMLRKLKRLNNRVANIDDQTTEIEKNKKLKELSKKVHQLKNKRKPSVIEVTNKNGNRSRVGKYKKGAKVKIVDRRMKKDLRGKKDGKKSR